MASGRISGLVVEAFVLEFTPALNRDKKVAVWIEQRITFEVR